MSILLQVLRNQSDQNYLPEKLVKLKIISVSLDLIRNACFHRVKIGRSTNYSDVIHIDLVLNHLISTELTTLLIIVLFYSNCSILIVP